MDGPQAEQVTGSDNWSLSIEEIRERVEEYYQPSEPGEERWFLCRRSTDNGTVCGQKCFFPHGVIAHENNHSITSGNGPLIRRSENKDRVSEQLEVTDYDIVDPDGEMLESIMSEFDNK